MVAKKCDEQNYRNGSGPQAFTHTHLPPGFFEWMHHSVHDWLLSKPHSLPQLNLRRVQILNDPKYLMAWELWCYGIFRSCRFFVSTMSSWASPPKSFMASRPIQFPCARLCATCARGALQTLRHTSHVQHSHCISETTFCSRPPLRELARKGFFIPRKALMLPLVWL